MKSARSINSKWGSYIFNKFYPIPRSNKRAISKKRKETNMNNWYLFQPHWSPDGIRYSTRSKLRPSLGNTVNSVKADKITHDIRWKIGALHGFLWGCNQWTLGKKRQRITETGTFTINYLNIWSDLWLWPH